MRRYDCLQVVARHAAEDDIVITSLGGTGLEWHAIRDTDSSFYGGAMGTHLPMAMGLARALPNRRVLCLESEGSLLHCAGVLATLANFRPELANLRVFILDNGVYDQTGRQPAATYNGRIDLANVARGFGLPQAVRAEALESWETAVIEALAARALTFVVAIVEPGTAKVAGRLTDGRENTLRFVRGIERSEGKQILTGQRSFTHPGAFAGAGGS